MSSRLSRSAATAPPGSSWAVSPVRTINSTSSPAAVVPMQSTSSATTAYSVLNTHPPTSQPEQEPNADQRPPAVFAKFFDLPAELRNKIYAMHLNENVRSTVDLEASNGAVIAPRLALLQTSRRIHAEAYPIFYGRHTFPIYGRFFKSKAPLLARLPARYRAALTALELRLGPGWSDPPASWSVTERLGLRDATAVRVLKVFVECDPSHDAFRGFRKNADFYTNFCWNLLRELLLLLPRLEEIHLDGYPSVSRDSGLIQKLVEGAEGAGRRVIWSPDKDWEAAPFAEGQHGW